MNDDLQVIRNLCYAYTFALDEGDFAAVGLLLEDATLRPVMPGVGDEGLRGRAAVERFYRDQVVTYSRGRPMTRHLITNHAIEVDEDDSARSRCYFTVLQRPPGLPYQIVVGGRYDDRFAKRDGAWRFTERAIHVDHLNEIGHHFRIADADRAQP